MSRWMFFLLTLAVGLPPVLLMMYACLGPLPGESWQRWLERRKSGDWL